MPNLDELLGGYDGDNPFMQYYFREEESHKRLHGEKLSVVLSINYVTEQVLVTGDGTVERRKGYGSNFHFATELMALGSTFPPNIS
jgi:hypothetical protein